jgi:hypothetical protein
MTIPKASLLEMQRGKRLERLLAALHEAIKQEGKLIPATRLIATRAEQS